MANEIALVTANTVSIVESTKQMTAPAGEAITPGAPVRFDTSTGRFMNGNATSTSENRIYGIATGKKAIPAGAAVTAVAIGVLDGFDLSAMNFGATVYVSDTDARLSTVAGTTTLVVGRVIPATATLMGATYDKILDVLVTDALAFVDTTS